MKSSERVIQALPVVRRHIDIGRLLAPDPPTHRSRHRDDDNEGHRQEYHSSSAPGHPDYRRTTQRSVGPENCQAIFRNRPRRALLRCAA